MFGADALCDSVFQVRFMPSGVEERIVYLCPSLCLLRIDSVARPDQKSAVVCPQPSLGRPPRVSRSLDAVPERGSSAWLPGPDADITRLDLGILF